MTTSSTSLLQILYPTFYYVGYVHLPTYKCDNFYNS